MLNDGASPPSFSIDNNWPGGESDGHVYAFGDIDGDGDLDAVCGNRYMMNAGGGSFTKYTFPGYLSNAQWVAMGDVDGDGCVDRTRTPLPKPVEPWRSSQLSDDISPLFFLSRSDLDVVFGMSSMNNVLQLFVGTVASPSFSVATNFPPSTNAARFVEIADLDNDGDLVSCLRREHRMSLPCLAEGPWLHACVCARVCFFVCVRQDIIIGNLDREEEMLLNDGSGLFTASTPFPSNRAGGKVAVADVNGDGLNDVVSGDDLFLNGAVSSWSLLSDSSPGGSTTTEAIVVGDFDNDGDLDVLVGGYQAYSYLYKNDGFGGLAQPVTLGYGNTRGLAVGDLNGDGLLDAVAVRYDFSNVQGGTHSSSATYGDEMMINNNGVGFIRSNPFRPSAALLSDWGTRAVGVAIG